MKNKIFSRPFLIVHKEESLPEEAREKVLTLIGHCYRDLELSHLFWDGNGRIHNFCILPKLLLENDLPPVIFDPATPPLAHNYGIEEIIPAIRRGQAIFEEMVSS